MGQERGGAAEMGELHADPAMALERARDDQLRQRARRLERELVEPDWIGITQRRRIRGKGRMDEDIRTTAIELIEEKFPALVTEINPGRVAQEHHAVELEPVKGVGELADCRVNVRQRNKRQPGKSVLGVAHDRSYGLVPPRASSFACVWSPRNAPGGPVEITTPSIP